MVAFLLVGDHSFTKLPVRAMYVCPEFTAPLMGARWIAQSHTESVVIFWTPDSTERRGRNYYSLLTLFTNFFLSKRETIEMLSHHNMGLVMLFSWKTFCRKRFSQILTRRHGNPFYHNRLVQYSLNDMCHPENGSQECSSSLGNKIEIIRKWFLMSYRRYLKVVERITTVAFEWALAVDRFRKILISS